MGINDSALDYTSNRSRGFVTIATGDHKYYQMAVNLLRSYRVNGETDLPFALICDKVCDEALEFDDMVILDHPNNSYLDKLSLDKYTPYQESIFIDADSLILSPVNNIWNDFISMGDFCCYGKVLPLDSNKGWFYYDGMGDIKDKLTFGINMHGGVYYLRKTKICHKIFDDAVYYAKNYHSYAFAQFRNPADEPVIALSMVLSNNKPCDRKDRILFLPSVDGQLHISSNGKLKLNGEICTVPILHLANINVKRYLYRYLVKSINNEFNGVNKSLDMMEILCLRIECLFPEIKAFIRRFLKRILPKKVANIIKYIIKK